ncbi:MAG: pyrroline-5-carboxylate reductase [Betaproteobacteria bacterium]
MKVTFVGGGNMASALIGGMLARGWPASHVRVAEVDAGARKRLDERFGVFASADLAGAAAGSDCLLFAVKPQQLRAVAATAAPLCVDRLVVSVAAGVRMADLARWLGGHERIVRVMPNTPALVRAGVSVACALPGVPGAQREAVTALLEAGGKVLWVGAESMIDAATAVSGSGPAYAFYLMEAMQEAAEKLGFAPDEARLLAVETVLGAGKLAESSEDSAAVLRKRVTSPGGTTERALAVLESRGVKAAVIQAVEAAEARARELGEAAGRE